MVMIGCVLAYTQVLHVHLADCGHTPCPSMALAARVRVLTCCWWNRTRTKECRAGVLSPLGPQHQRASSLQRQVWPGVRTIYRQHTCNFIPQCAGWTAATSFNGQQTAGDNLGPSVLGSRQVQGLQPPSSHPLPSALGTLVGALGHWSQQVVGPTHLLPRLGTKYCMHSCICPSARGPVIIIIINCPIHACCINREPWSASPDALIFLISHSPASPPSRP